MDYKILDREFRDYTAEQKYPFSDRASLSSVNGMFINPSTFLDIILYIPETVVMPVYLHSVEDYGDGEAKAVFNDSVGAEVANCVLSSSSDNAVLYSSGIESGAIVYNKVEIRKIINAAHGFPLVFGPNLPIQLDRCFCYTPNNISGVGLYDDVTLSGDVYILGANGVFFTEDGDSLRINLLGEEPVTGSPVLSVNGVSRKHIWVAAHPNSGVKVETGTNGIKLRSIKDG